MARESRTRDVEKHFYRNYFSRAESCLKLAEKALEVREFDPAALLAVHTAISAGDAFCVWFLAKRSASPRHADAVTLFKSSLPGDSGAQEAAKWFGHVLGYKEPSEYAETLIRESDARAAVREAARLLAFVKSKLPRD